MNIVDLIPQVIEFNPDTYSPLINVRPNFKARFNIDVDSAQFNTSQKINSLIILTEESTDTNINVALTSYEDRILLFSPVSDLNPGSSYQITFLQGIISTAGRSMKGNRNFRFTVSETNVPQVTLLDPGDNTAYAINPTFSWSAVTVTGTGTLQYRIQVDQNITFTSINTLGWTTLTSYTSALPGIVLAQDNPYFWKVRAELTTQPGSALVGPWSEVRAFYLGSQSSPSPSTRVTYPGAAPFSVLSPAALVNGESNLQTFPSLIFAFSDTIDETSINSNSVYMLRESVDGYPNSNKTRVNITVTANSSAPFDITYWNYETILLLGYHINPPDTLSTITITIDDPLMVNTRYTLYISGLKNLDGEYLSSSFSIYFTSRYSPLYVGANVLSANLGQFLVDFPKDLINFHIFRTSIDANREYLTYFNNPFFGGPTEEQVRNFIFQIPYEMEKWVEAMASIKLLNMRRYELLAIADQNRRLGDYSESIGTDLLKDIDGIIKTLKGEAAYHFAAFAKHRARPSNVVKASRWSPYKEYLDHSWVTHIKKKF